PGGRERARQERSTGRDRTGRLWRAAGAAARSHRADPRDVRADGHTSRRRRPVTRAHPAWRRAWARPRSGAASRGAFPHVEDYGTSLAWTVCMRIDHRPRPVLIRHDDPETLP